MKKISSVLMVLIILIGFPLRDGAAFNPNTSHIDLKGEAAVLIERETEEVLYEKNMHQKMYPASTTKIMTAMVALEYGDLEEMVTVGEEILSIPSYSNKADLVVGEKITLHHLLYGLLLPSGNDAANTIAVHISKKVMNDPDLSREEAYNKFAELMNQKTAELGVKQTHFKNPHGFHDVDQFTTPWDMAIIAKEAMKNNVFREIVQTPELHYSSGVNQPQRKWENTNYLIHENNENFYPYTSGIKTGNTAAAGKCLVSSATKDNLDLIAVVLKSTDDQVWEDTIALLSYGFENFENHSLTKEGGKVITVELENGQSNHSNKVDIIAQSTLEKLVDKKDIPKIQREISWENTVLHASSNNQTLGLSSSIKKGEKIGEVTYSLNGKVIGESSLIAGEDIKKNSFIPRWIAYSMIGIVFITIVGTFNKVKK